MSYDNRRLNQLIVPIGQLPPVTGAQSSVESTWVDMSKQRQILAVLNIGVVGTSVDAAMQQATTSSGTSKKAMSPAVAITQITSSTAVVTMELSNYQLDRANSFDFAAIDITTVHATTAAAGMIYGGPKDKYQPSTTISAEDIQETIS